MVWSKFDDWRRQLVIPTDTLRALLSDKGGVPQDLISKMSSPKELRELEMRILSGGMDRVGRIRPRGRVQLRYSLRDSAVPGITPAKLDTGTPQPEEFGSITEALERARVLKDRGELHQPSIDGDKWGELNIPWSSNDIDEWLAV